MSTNCKVIKDLLPLYADGACSEETKKLVEKHIGDCEDCFEELRKMQSPIETENAEEVKKRFSAKKAFKKVRRIWIISVIIILVIAVPLAYLGVNQATNNGGVSFTNISAVLAANKVASAFKSNDAGRIAEALNDAFAEDYIGFTNEDPWQFGTYIGPAEELPQLIDDHVNYKYSEITVDGVKYFATQDVVENEYAEYLENGDAAKFWLNIINNGKAAVPDKALTLVKEKYKSLIDEKALNKLIFGWYGVETYYYDKFDTTNDGGFVLHHTQVVPEKYYNDMVQLEKEMAEASKVFTQNIIDQGPESYVEQARQSIYKNIKTMTGRGYRISGVDFKSCNLRNGAYYIDYDLNFKGPGGDVKGIYLTLKYENGKITDAIEGFPTGMGNYADAINLLKIEIKQ